jgi:MerR family copper efflux transcriptional regulator
MTNMLRLRIGEVAQRAGVSPATVRYYEEIGLLPAPPRSAAGYRRYTEDTVDELLFIRKAQTLGFSLDEIREILRLSRSGKTPCSHVLSLTRQHLAALDERIRQLEHVRKRLASELSKWERRSPPDCRGLCQIIASAETGVGGAASDGNPRWRSRRAAGVAVRTGITGARST